MTLYLACPFVYVLHFMKTLSKLLVLTTAPEDIAHPEKQKAHGSASYRALVDSCLCLPASTVLVYISPSHCHLSTMIMFVLIVPLSSLSVDIPAVYKTCNKALQFVSDCSPCAFFLCGVQTNTQSIEAFSRLSKWEFEVENRRPYT